MSGPTEQRIAVFSDLVAENRGRVFGYIYAMLHNMADAEDIYQQTTVLMWQKFDEFQPETNFGSWALKIAYFTIKNFQRSQQRNRVFFRDSVMEKVAGSYRALDEGQSSERVDALIACVKRLPESHQRILRMHYVENAPIQQIAERQGRSRAAVSMVLSRLRRVLFQCIRSKLATE